MIFFALIAVLGIFVICIGLVFPIIAIVKCVSSGLSNTAKVCWIVGMVLTWPLACYIYFVIYASTTTRRVLSALMVLFSLAGTAMTISGWKNHPHSLLDALSNDTSQTHSQSLGQSLLDSAEQRAHATEIRKIETIRDMFRGKSISASDDNKKAYAIVVQDLGVLENEIKNMSDHDYAQNIETFRHLTDTALATNASNLPNWQKVFAGRAIPGATPAQNNAVPPAAVPTPPAAILAPRQYCEKLMTDYAVKNNADPAPYIAQNQAYLQQCIASQTK